MLQVFAGDLAADYGSDDIDPAKIKALGYKFVVRYIDGPGLSWKDIDALERDAIYRAGLGLLLVFETSATRALLGGAAGSVDGKKAAADTYALGIPAVAPILIAVDTDVTSATKAAVRSYVAAFAQAAKPYPVGVYGDYDTIEAVKDLSVLNWQANAAGWSGVWQIVNGVRKFFRRTHPLAHVLQLTQVTTPAGTIDPNRVLRPFSVWDGEPPAPPYNPPSSFGGWPTATKRTFTPTESGAEIRYAQDVIFFKAGGNVPRNGVFDLQTAARVQDVQRLFLITDEMPNIGPKTWAAIDYLAVH